MALDRTTPFVWGAGGAPMTPQAAEAQRKVAQALLMQGMDYSPVRSPWQGAARVAQALVGGYESAQADASDRKLAEMQPQMLATALTGAIPGASSQPIASPMGNLPAMTATPQADTTGKIYSNDEPSPLDPPSGADRDAAIRTVLAEAGNQGSSGMNAVASVIRNRAVNGGFGGDTPAAVVTAPSQFEPWNTAAGRSRMAAIDPNSPAYAAAGNALDSAYMGNDPTNGATMFYGPKAQAALGRPAPSWDNGTGVDIGDHRFFGGAPRVARADSAALPANSQPAQFVVPGQAAQAASMSKIAPLISLASSPYASPATKQIAGVLLSSQLSAIQKANDPMTALDRQSKILAIKKAQQDLDGQGKFAVIGEDNMGRKQYGFVDSTAGKVTPYTPQNAQTPDSDLADLHGEDFFSALQKQDPAISTQVRAIVEGRAPYPTGMLLKTPYGQRLAQLVTQADPSFETGNAMARVKVRNEFSAGGVGSPAGQISAGNTALQHAGEMSDALERLKSDGGVLPDIGSAGIPIVSYYANKLHNAAIQGTPAGKALNDFMTAKNHFSEEVTKFYAGSAGSEAERTRALANLDAAKSLPELRSAIKTEANLMQGKVNALQTRWRNGMGPLVKDFPLISPESQSAVDRILQRDQSSEQQAVSGQRKTSTGISWSVQ